MNAHRYAIYWAPEAGHPLWRAGCDWLGRDPAGTEAEGPPNEDVRDPWRYGFHATLKPPLRLCDGAQETSLVEAAQALAAHTPAFDMPRLQVTWLDNFMALCPSEPLDEAHPLRRLADSCVSELDAWRAPPPGSEIERRLAFSPLDDEQRSLLQRWGYPHVFGRWRFHLTLSNSVPAADVERRRHLEDRARAHFAAALTMPCRTESISLFVEPSPGAPFRLARRLPLAAP